MRNYLHVKVEIMYPNVSCFENSVLQTLVDHDHTAILPVTACL